MIVKPRLFDRGFYYLIRLSINHGMLFVYEMKRLRKVRCSTKHGAFLKKIVFHQMILMTLFEQQRKMVFVLHILMRFLNYGILLHFCYCDTAITRQDYKDRLSEHMNHKYCKESEIIFDEIFERQKLAIQNAKRLLKTYNASY